MSSRAEQRALEAYPRSVYEPEHFVMSAPGMCNGFFRKVFQRGYEQAEKDLALTWQDVRDIIVIADSMLTRTAWDDVEWPDEKVYYEEVLRKFKEQR